MCKRIGFLIASYFLIIACQGETTQRETAQIEVNPALLGAEGLDEEESAPLMLTGLGDRVCILRYAYVEKKGTDFEVIANDSVSDNSKRPGFGRGCMNFCVASFDALREKNEAEGRSILIRNCVFSANEEKVEKADQPMQKEAVKEFEDAKNGMCKIVGGAHNLILGEIMKEDACKAECDSREQANPQRRCSFKGEVFRKHPKKFCTIQGIAGKIHYNKKVRKFICRAECKAREVSNPKRSCEWGDDLLRDHPKN